MVRFFPYCPRLPVVPSTCGTFDQSEARLCEDLARALVFGAKYRPRASSTRLGRVVVVVAVVAAWLPPCALAQLRTVTIDNLKPRLDTQGNIVDAHDGTVQVRCVQRSWEWAWQQCGVQRL